MVTPELQNYIAQCRVQGMTDAQIQAALVTKGWNAADVSAALSGQPLTSQPIQQAFVVPSAYAPATPGKSHTSLIVGIILAVLILPGLIWSIFMYVMSRGALSAISGGGLPGILSKIGTGSGPGALGTYSGSSGNNNLPGSSESGSLAQAPVTPVSGWPSDTPTYPGSKLIDSRSVPGNNGTTDYWSTYTTSDSPDVVSKYFTDNSSGWKITVFENSNSATDGRTIVLLGEKSKERLTLAISQKPGETTTIVEQRGEYTGM